MSWRLDLVGSRARSHWSKQLLLQFTVGAETLDRKMRNVRLEIEDLI